MLWFEHHEDVSRRYVGVSRWVRTVALFAFVGPLCASENSFDRVVLHPAIPLLDEQGRHVLDSGFPYSPRMSCGNGAGGGCHDYAKITRAYHFEQGRDETRDGFGKPLGLPQLTGPGYFGGYTCMSGNNPGWLARQWNGSAAEFSDYGAPDLVKYCGGCHVGGGWSEFDREGRRYDEIPPGTIAAFAGDYFSRSYERNGGSRRYGGMGASEIVPWDWQKSGVKEADCLLCHADFARLRPLTNEGSALEQYSQLRDGWTQQGFFRYAASALLAFLDVRPDLAAGQTLLQIDPVSAIGRSFQNPESRPPVLAWQRQAFDDAGKVQIPMRRFPASENCMFCHVTGNGRRGFYGFGEDVRLQTGPGGTLLTDYRSDVHKGVLWHEDNGEARTIENCNACHAKQYYKASYLNVDLDADHDFPKGNGDCDVRNDLDGLPGPKSCEHCHDRARRPALPSGHANVVDAHREIWKANGDMAGYPERAIDRITRTHLRVVACQTCHISALADQGVPIPIRYRYRVGENGQAKIFPVKPAYRYYLQDRNSGYVLSRAEREAVLEERGDGQAVIVDPVTRKPLGQVPMLGDDFGEPATYQDYRALKFAYDSLLRWKGYADPDVRFVLSEANQYAISHATRPAVAALQCEDCHARKQSGAFSSLLATQGVLGRGNVAEVMRLPDRRLVDEGIFLLGMPYYRVEQDGRVVENVADVLYASRLDPSMSILKAETARVLDGKFKTVSLADAVAYLGMQGHAGALQSLGSDPLLWFQSKVGHASLRGFALLSALGPRTQAMGTLRGRVQSNPATGRDRTRILRQRASRVIGDLYTFAVMDEAGTVLDRLPENQTLMRLPYRGSARKQKGMEVLYSADGKTWQRIKTEDVLAFEPRGEEDGFVVVRVRWPQGKLVLADKIAGKT